MQRFLAIICGLLVTIGMSAQVQTRALRPSIKTLQAVRLSATEPERPFLILQDGIVDGTDEDNTLHISFDEMSHDVHFYTYTVLHLDRDGQPSDITTGEYLRGFTTADISDYRHSQNTAVSYTHYQFNFPNEDMQLTASGRYKLKIYEDNNPDQGVAEVDFVVVDPRVQILPQLRYNTQREINGRFQQLDIDVQLTAINMRDPQEVSLVVEQNNRTDNHVVLTQPTFVQGDGLRYINQPALIFEGGNEYRHLDCFSTYLAGHNIDRIAYTNGAYHALLFPDEVRTNQEQYIHEFDSDGQFVVNAERTEDVDTEAEYMWVHWMMPSQPRMDGTFYVGGDLFENRLSEANRMQYDYEHGCYYLTALLKQGGYDYQYWFLEKGKTTASTQMSEGSYWETQNRYAIYVYYRPFGGRYDQLVGLKLL
ncbi:MAG: DUF5103 domain-containing protein [Paludibacteraceae bacterium]|nr:DUF5103 domain-containing protein [Paludibacteraceae bacterium]